jgi:hypothetical protein
MRSLLMIAATLGFAGAGLTADLWAQVRIVGRVIDEMRRPVEGVEVIVNRLDVRAVTDSTGLFTLGASLDDSTIAFRRIGYRPLLLTLQPLPPTGDTILVRLAPSPVPLPEVIVSARPSKPLRYAGTTKYNEVFLRRRIGLGRLITREEIDQKAVIATHELLEGVSGIRIWNGPPKRIRFIRCEEPDGIAVFFDGVRQITAATSPARGPRTFTVEDEPVIEILSRINPSDVELIEVFQGASEIPGVYHWNGCAVIAIWTRWN